MDRYNYLVFTHNLQRSTPSKNQFFTEAGRHRSTRVVCRILRRHVISWAWTISLHFVAAVAVTVAAAVAVVSVVAAARLTLSSP